MKYVLLEEYVDKLNMIIEIKTKCLKNEKEILSTVHVEAFFGRDAVASHVNVIMFYDD